MRGRHRDSGRHVRAGDLDPAETENLHLGADTVPREGVPSQRNPAHKWGPLVPWGGRPKSHPDGMCPGFRLLSPSEPPAPSLLWTPSEEERLVPGLGTRGQGQCKVCPGPPYLLLPTQMEVRPRSKQLAWKLGVRTDSGHQGGDGLSWQPQEGRGGAGHLRTAGLHQSYAAQTAGSCPHDYRAVHHCHRGLHPSGPGLPPAIG